METIEGKLKDMKKTQWSFREHEESIYNIIINSFVIKVASTVQSVSTANTLS